MKSVLVTGGCGYIGSHFVVKLIESGMSPIIYDDFSNSSPRCLDRIQEITGIRPLCYQGDIRDPANLAKVFSHHLIDSVVHFAGKKSVNESEKLPLLYYSVNVEGSINLLRQMEKFKVWKLLFSSTATVYGNGCSEAVKEDFPLNPINNYGKSKLMFENVMRELSLKEKNWSFGILRYFNPVGAHQSGIIGENPSGTPANLMPFISQVAAGKRKELKIFGDDYPTRDGTGSRDYIHVEDLVEAHLLVLHYLDKHKGTEILNLGTGRDTTVLELVKAFKEVNDVDVPFSITGRREGDSATCFADPTKAKRLLNWKARYSIKDMCKDVWRWQLKNPDGY